MRLMFSPSMGSQWMYKHKEVLHPHKSCITSWKHWHVFFGIWDLQVCRAVPSPIAALLWDDSFLTNIFTPLTGVDPTCPLIQVGLDTTLVASFNTKVSLINAHNCSYKTTFTTSLMNKLVWRISCQFSWEVIGYICMPPKSWPIIQII